MGKGNDRPIKFRDYNLQERLSAYALMISQVVDNLPDSRVGQYLADQLIRSGLSPALHYGEACAAESPKDFVHKMSVVLKELRESLSSCSLIRSLHLLNEDQISKVVKESDELVAIFVTSIQTAKANHSLR